MINDETALQLIKRHHLDITAYPGGIGFDDSWIVKSADYPYISREAYCKEDLNQAIEDCVRELRSK